MIPAVADRSEHIEQHPYMGGKLDRIAVAGGTLPVEVIGQGPSTLFIHGWTLDRRAWWPQVERRALSAQAVLYDRRGCGQSDAPPSLGMEPDDIVRLLDHLRIDQAALVAMSQGVRVALAFAATYPDRVTALVLQGAPALFPDADAVPGGDAPVALLTQLAQQQRWDDVREIWRCHPLLALPGGEGAAILEAMLNAYRGRDLLFPGKPLAFTLDSLAALHRPTLFLHGEHESAERKVAAHRLAGLMPCAEIAEIRGGGHLCNLCSPVAYNAALARFLRQFWQS